MIAVQNVCHAVGSKLCRETSRYFDEEAACYVFYSDKVLTWYDARNKCLKKGGDLASFINLNHVGLSKLATSPHWVGLRNGWWSWIKGGQFFSNDVTINVNDDFYKGEARVSEYVKRKVNKT